MEEKQDLNEDITERLETLHTVGRPDQAGGGVFDLQKPPTEFEVAKLLGFVRACSYGPEATELLRRLIFQRDGKAKRIAELEAQIRLNIDYSKQVAKLEARIAELKALLTAAVRTIAELRLGTGGGE